MRGLPTAPRDLTFKSNLKIARMVWEMPSYVVGIKNALNRQAELLDKMTSNLAKALKYKNPYNEAKAPPKPGQALPITSCFGVRMRIAFMISALSGLTDRGCSVRWAP